MMRVGYRQVAHDAAGSASAIYLTFGGLQSDYASLMVITGFIVTLAGQLLTYHIIAVCGRRSVIIMAMAILLSTGAVIMGYEAARIIRQDWPDHILYHDTVCGDNRRT